MDLFYWLIIFHSQTYCQLFFCVYPLLLKQICAVQLKKGRINIQILALTGEKHLNICVCMWFSLILNRTFFDKKLNFQLHFSIGTKQKLSTGQLLFQRILDIEQQI